MKPLLMLLCFVAITACGTSVYYDYEDTANFNALKTYNYFNDIKSGLTPLDEKRLKQALDTKLKQLGFTKADNPDIFIDVVAADLQPANTPNVGVNVGGGSGGIGGGIGLGIPIKSNKATRELIVEMVAKNRKTLLWQAKSVSTYKYKANPEQRVKYFDTLVSEIMSKYPPSK